jgi:hypothetical protein
MEGVMSPMEPAGASALAGVSKDAGGQLAFAAILRDAALRALPRMSASLIASASE